MLIRFKFLKSFFLFSILVLLCACGKKKTNNNVLTSKARHENNKPNIVVIVVDDAGCVDFGYMGSKDLETPHIDNLASDGVVFTDATLAPRYVRHLELVY